MNVKKIALSLAAAALVAVGAAGCSSDADVASHNLSQAADNFEVQRRIVFYNGINGEYILEVQGLCSLGNDRTATELSVTCKVAAGSGASAYKKHFLGLSDNVTYFAEQIHAVEADPFRYRVIFKPETIVPDVQVKVSK